MNWTIMSSKPRVVDSNGNRDLECGPNWAGLLPELLAEIAIRLPYMEDFAAFREVCKPWRAAAAARDTFNRKFKGVSKIPFLMLAEKDGCSSSSDERQLYSLYKKAVWTTVSFPWLKNKRCTDVGCGWVVTVAAEGGEVNLVKSFTGATIKLPNFTTCFPGYSPVLPEYRYIGRGILSADPSITSDFVLMVNASTGGLGFWRLGDENWRMVDDPRPRFLFFNIGYYKGKMLDIDYRGNVRMRDPSSAADFTKSDFIVHVQLRSNFDRMRPYIVESSSGELLLIFRNNYKYGADGFQTQFKVARVDVVKGTCESVEGGIGKDAIFLGENVAVAVNADDFPGVIKPNCVYYTDDCMEVYSHRCSASVTDSKGGGRDMGIYNFEDGSIQRFPVEESQSYLCPPLWIFPSF